MNIHYTYMNLSAVDKEPGTLMTFHAYCLLVSVARLMPRSQRSAGCGAAAASPVPAPAPANLIFDPLNAGLAGHQAPAHRG